VHRKLGQSENQIGTEDSRLNSKGPLAPHDKRVLVTGGTRGIGAAVVRRFQLAGARVVATALSAPAHAVDGVLFIPADIGTAAGVETVISRLAADWGGLDILVSNAGGVETKPGGFESLSDADWQAIIDLNLVGRRGWTARSSPA
jgi:NAD(P)-dependent dehydrogenase (short-subunit alcohol dehydrogenase family)